LNWSIQWRSHYIRHLSRPVCTTIAILLLQTTRAMRFRATRSCTRRWEGGIRSWNMTWSSWIQWTTRVRSSNMSPLLILLHVTVMSVSSGHSLPILSLNHMMIFLIEVRPQMKFDLIKPLISNLRLLRSSFQYLLLHYNYIVHSLFTRLFLHLALKQYSPSKYSWNILET